jgi:hypothetical protein
MMSNKINPDDVMGEEGYFDGVIDELAGAAISDLPEHAPGEDVSDETSGFYEGTQNHDHSDFTDMYGSGTNRDEYKPY